MNGQEVVSNTRSNSRGAQVRKGIKCMLADVQGLGVRCNVGEGKLMRLPEVLALYLLVALCCNYYVDIVFCL